MVWILKISHVPGVLMFVYIINKPCIAIQLIQWVSGQSWFNRRNFYFLYSYNFVISSRSLAFAVFIPNRHQESRNIPPIKINLCTGDSRITSFAMTTLPLDRSNGVAGWRQDRMSHVALFKESRGKPDGIKPFSEVFHINIIISNIWEGSRHTAPHHLKIWSSRCKSC